MTGPVLAIGVIGASFGYGFVTRNRRKMGEDVEDGKEQQTTTDINHVLMNQTIIFIGNDAKNVLELVICGLK